VAETKQTEISEARKAGAGKGTASPAAEPKQAKPKADSKPIDGIWVRTAGGSFRRAGFAFNQHGSGIALDALTDEQLAAIESEPRLIVERCTFGGDDIEAGK
jgi:hypothetical protein